MFHITKFIIKSQKIFIRRNIYYKLKNKMKNQLIHKEFESPKPSISSRDRKAVQKSFKLASNNGDYSHNNSSVVLGNYVNSGYWKFVGNILVTNVSSVPVSIRKKKSRLYESPSPSKPSKKQSNYKLRLNIYFWVL